MTSIAAYKRILDHGAVDRTVSFHDVDKQLQTAAALEPRLARFGGAILGDEVGTGKTFVAFATLTAALLKDKHRGALILVPTQLLEAKWERQLRDYVHQAVRDRTAGDQLAKRIVRLDRSLQVVGKGGRPSRNAIIIGRHSLFAFRISRFDQAVAVDAYLRSRLDLTRRPFARFLKACGLSLKDVDSSRAGWADHELLRKSPNLTQPIGALFERWSAGERTISEGFPDAIQQVRRLVGRHLLPSSSLVIIDEAHNLRSTNSKIYTSLMHTLAGKFDALLFLTGTPFQLGRHELRNVVAFFRNARGHEAERQVFDALVERMDMSMDGYVRALGEFGRAWMALEQTQCERVVALVRGAPVLADEDKVASDTADLFKLCIVARQRLEEGLRPFLLRSVRERHHHEIEGLSDASLLSPESRIPLALVDRMLFELFRERGKTFAASVSLGACSSWDALLASAAMDRSRAEGHSTRSQLISLNEKKALGPHPKVESTVHYCQSGLADGEKTLIFVERVLTGGVLKSTMDARLRKLETSDDAKDSLQKKSRFGWPSLRENYLHTVYPLAFGRDPSRRALNRLAREYRVLYERVDTGSGTRDYAIEKRFWDHVYIHSALEQGAPLPSPGYLRETVERLADPDYILNGLSLESNESELRLLRPRGNRGEKTREPRMEFARAYLCYPSPWKPHARDLAIIPPAWRAHFVEQAAASIGRSHLPGLGRPGVDGPVRCQSAGLVPHPILDRLPTRADYRVHNGTPGAAP